MLDRIRKTEFPALNGLYFNTAAHGPSPLRAKRMAEQVLEEELDPGRRDFREWSAIPDRTRERIAGLLGASADSVAIHGSVTEVIQQLATGFPFSDGDVVVSREGEYPSNVLPWMIHEGRFKLHLLPTEAIYDVDVLRKCMPARARLLNISHVAFDTGRKADLFEIGKLCRERGIFLVADCSQSFGGLQITPDELRSVDLLVGVTYKWLLGPYGGAFAYYSEEALRLLPRGSGTWLASPNSKSSSGLTRYTTETLPGARRFDRGQAPNMLHMSALRGGLDLIAELGLDAIEDHNAQLVRRFLETFPKSAYELSVPLCGSNIVSLRRKDADPEKALQALTAQGVHVSLREGKIRFALHFFNSLEEVDRLTQALETTA